MSPAGLHADAAEIKKARQAAGPEVILVGFMPSDAATVVAAPAVDVPLDVLLVTGERSIFRQPHVLRGGIEALAGIRRFFHFRRQVGQECNLLLHILPGAKPATRSGMACNDTVTT